MHDFSICFSRVIKLERDTQVTSRWAWFLAWLVQESYLSSIKMNIAACTSVSYANLLKRSLAWNRYTGRGTAKWLCYWLSRNWTRSGIMPIIAACKSQFWRLTVILLIEDWQQWSLWQQVLNERRGIFKPVFLGIQVEWSTKPSAWLLTSAHNV